jgi:hypothetical protein
MKAPAKRRFLATIRGGRSSTQIGIEANDERAATGLLEFLYGTQNIIEVRPVDDNDEPDQISQAESDVGDAVTQNLLLALGAVTKWILRGAFKR